MQNIFKKSFFGACLNISGIYFWISFFVLILSFSNNLLIIVSIYKIFNHQDSSINLDIEILLSLIASRFLIGYVQLLIEKRIRRKFCKKVADYFKFSSWELSDKSLISTLISRDILLLLDTVSIIPKIFYFPICFIIGAIVIYKLIGLNGVIAISTVALFAPFSLVIAKKSIRLASEIYRLSKLRLEEISKWLEWRSIINNWNDGGTPIKRINVLTEKEIAARNLDSIWRCIDLYIITFGRCLPVAIVIIISLLFKNDVSNQLILTMWLSVPFIALVMEAGRFTTDFQLGKQALAELKKASKALLQNESCLILDNSWEIWDGTLLENCMTDPDNSYLELSKKLRLDEELTSINNEIYLSRFGANISEGQRTRILLIRAIHLALKNKTLLKIECALSSLDPDACYRLVSILQQPKIVDLVTLSSACKDFLEHQISRSTAIQQTDKKYIASNKSDYPGSADVVKPGHNNILKDLLIFLSPMTLLFLLPAMSLSFIGCIAIATIPLADKLIALLLVSILSIIFVVYIGAKNESRTRQWAKIKMLDILLNAKLKNTVDIFQRLSRDFTVMVERISWYIHDITWLFSLLLISIIATVFSFGALGVLIAGIFLFLSVSLWRFFEVKINTARTASVNAVNEALIMGENLVAYGKLAGSQFINRKREALIQSSIDNLCQSNIKLISLKSIFSNLIMCTSGLFIFAILFGFLNSWISDELFVFILTAILSVDASIGMLFQALSGFSAQRISMHRLLKYEKNNNDVSANSLLIKQKNNYLFNGAINPTTGVKYLPISFKSGDSYSLLGDSGVGKSQFLKFISGVYADGYLDLDSSRVSAIYINKDAYKIASWIQNDSSDYTKWTKENFNYFIKTKILKGRFKIIILDEALAEFDITVAHEIISLIKNYVDQIGGLLLFVDHRFTLEKSIYISNIQLSSIIL